MIELDIHVASVMLFLISKTLYLEVATRILANLCIFGEYSLLDIIAQSKVDRFDDILCLDISGIFKLDKKICLILCAKLESAIFLVVTFVETILM